MFCRECGKELPDGSKFCPNCGANQVTEAISENNNTSEGKSFIKKFHVIPVVSFVISIISIIAIFFPTLLNFEKNQ